MNLGRYIFRIGFFKLSNNDDKKCKQNSTVNELVVQKQVEKIKINSYHRKYVILFNY